MTTLLNTAPTQAAPANSGDQPQAGQTHIEIFSDGSCKNNPGPGGYGIVTLRRDAQNKIIKSREASGWNVATTNIRMEMTATCVALEALGDVTEEPITMFCDLNLISNAMNGWLANWKANGWRKSDRKPVENRDLWERLDAAAAGRNVTWKWIKGHQGHEHNERADTLAGLAADKAAAHKMS